MNRFIFFENQDGRHSRKRSVDQAKVSQRGLGDGTRRTRATTPRPGRVLTIVPMPDDCNLSGVDFPASQRKTGIAQGKNGASDL